MTERVRHWQARLVDALNVELHKPFDWRDAHCLDLIHAAVRACKGEDHPFLGMNMHGTEEECMAWLNGGSVGGLRALLKSYFNEIPYSWAQDGDVGVVTIAGQDIGCVCVDGIAKLKLGNRRVMGFPIAKMSVVYRV